MLLVRGGILSGGILSWIQADRQTNKQTDIPYHFTTPPPYGGRGHNRHVIVGVVVLSYSDNVFMSEQMSHRLKEMRNSALVIARYIVDIHFVCSGAPREGS